MAPARKTTASTKAQTRIGFPCRRGDKPNNTKKIANTTQKLRSEEERSLTPLLKSSNVLICGMTAVAKPSRDFNSLALLVKWMELPCETMLSGQRRSCASTLQAEAYDLRTEVPLLK